MVIKAKLKLFVKKILTSSDRFLLRYPFFRNLLIAWFRRLGIYQFICSLRGLFREEGYLDFFIAKGKVIAPYRVLPISPTLPESMCLPQAPADFKPWFRLTGHVEDNYSLAIVNRGLAAALERNHNQLLSFIPYHGQPYEKPPNLPSDQDAQLRGSLNRRIPDELCNEVVSIVSHYPFITDQLPAGLRGIIFFWEETSVPADRVEIINKHFDIVWVAAESVKRALLNSGCKPSIFVIPIGIDHLITPKTPPLGVLTLKDQQLVRFLHVSSVFERKGVDVLLNAYFDAFTADDAVELYIKTFPNPHNNIHQQLEQFRAKLGKTAKVVIDETPLNDNAMVALYQSSHAMVLPARGEGFNLPAAEAMAMGLPVITTGAGAQVDFCSQDTATLVGYHIDLSRSHLRSSDSCWFEPDSADLCAKLKKLHQSILSNSPDLKAQRQAGMQYVRDTYSWDNATRGLLASIHWFAHQHKNDGHPIRLALLSPWATRCGIAEYSQKLMSAMMDTQQVQVTVYCDKRTQSTPVEADPCWTLGNNDSVIGVLKRLERSDTQVLLVQHQPSLFRLSDTICSQLASLKRQGKVVILELHSTLPLMKEGCLSVLAVSELAKIDRIIVHKLEDLNHMLALGLSNNVMLLHHGVVQPLLDSESQRTRVELDIPNDALVLGSFGFALEHKGIDTLIRAIKPLTEASGRNVYLVALNSLLDERSENLIQQYQLLARQLGVASNIHWITDYRSIETCQHILGASDFLVFPYRDTNESASGAVTIGLSTLKPVLVSPQTIFSDLQDVTWKMDGHEVEDIVKAVQVIQAQPDMTLGLIERQRNWLHARDWNVLSTRLMTLMGSLRREHRLKEAVDPSRYQWRSRWNVHRRKQLLVDISEIYHRGYNTGIQRVVRNILNELFNQPPAGYDIIPVYANKGDCFRYTGKFYPHGFVELLEGCPLQVGPEDIFLGLDLAAHLFPEAEQHLSTFRLAGARVYYVVYDIIPLQHAQFTAAGMTQAFKVWLSCLARCADGLICISASVAHDVAGWLYEHAPAPGTPLPMISHFHLGANIDSTSLNRGLPDDAETSLANMGAGVCFLMVGTIEPRKGHAQTLAAFEKLWSEFDDSRLVLVGKQGWNMDKFAQCLRQHPQAGKKLLWLEEASDEYLEKIYARADCLIAASKCEGFGLPLIEAAKHNLPIIARDISVFREVAGDFAHYFKAEHPEELAKVIKGWLSMYQNGQHPKSDNMPWLTWKESADQLIKTLRLSRPIKYPKRVKNILNI
jgi:glycosyltransferase involved in cell wall biosynthesis